MLSYTVEEANSTESANSINRNGFGKSSGEEMKHDRESNG
jgi:hypothetical protein